MKRSLAAIGAAGALALTALPATAQAEEVAPFDPFASSVDTSAIDGALASLTETSSNAVAAWSTQLGSAEGLFPGILPAPVPAGECAPQEFDAVVDGWPGVAGTIVEWCNGEWAVAGANQTDWKVFFHHDGQNWVGFAPDGSKKTGLQQGCFNGITLREQGAPQEFLDRTPICTPEEIGYFPR